ncbi:MAG: alginate export family protein [Wenzhouxiangellaceae bacterium]|nr:alginate export family protein [Wenzhouxiangellaceae bacterium]
MSAASPVARKIATALAAALLAMPASADAGEIDLDVGVDFRARIELVEEEGFDEDAEAATLRTRLHLDAPIGSRWRGFLEFSDVREIGLDDYNAGAGATPDRSRFPVVADPEDTRVNQAWLQFSPADGLRLRAGRQRIKLDNDRFVGNVGWRQNEQTYDGATAEWNSGRWNLFYGWVGHVNRIFASDVPAGDHDHDTHLLNASFAVAEGHVLSGYLYRIEDEDAQALSNRTAGLRYTGGTGDWAWLLEAAHQSDTGGNPFDYDAVYAHARLDLALAPSFEPFAGFERLGDDDGARAFQTPLATLHAFNGWADRFLATPARGLDDLYAGFSGGRDRLGWTVAAHRFATVDGSDLLGHELDASLSIRIDDHVSVLVKAAHFADDDAGVAGATKFWIMLAGNW